jgi:hypothetical protein
MTVSVRSMICADLVGAFVKSRKRSPGFNMESLLQSTSIAGHASPLPSMTGRQSVVLNTGACRFVLAFAIVRRLGQIPMSPRTSSPQTVLQSRECERRRDDGHIITGRHPGGDRRESNTVRPHISLGYATPKGYSAACDAKDERKRNTRR